MFSGLYQQNQIEALHFVDVKSGSARLSLPWPSNLMLILAFLGAVLLATRFARAGLQCLLASILLLAIFGLSPLASAMILPLEQRFSPWESPRGAPDGIIVLGDAFDPRIAAGRGEVSLNESAERMTSAVELARRYPNMRIVFSGGAVKSQRPS